MAEPGDVLPLVRRSAASGALSLDRWLMQGRFEKHEIVLLLDSVRMPFKVPSRKGIIRFVFDHDPPAYEVEFFWEGRSLGEHYLTDDELAPFAISRHL